MIYVYDILINFIDSKRIYEVFEWNKDDEVEHIKRIPLFLVDYSFIDSLINYDVSVSKEFLEIIKDKTLLYTGGKIKHATLLTEGNRVYAFEFNEDGEIEYFSSLLLDEEEDVLELTPQLDISKVEYKVKNKDKKAMYLTRKDEQNRNYIIKDLKYTYKSKNYSKLKYLYRECFGDDKTSNKEKLDRLISSLDKIDSPVRNKLNYILKLSYKSTCK